MRPVARRRGAARRAGAAAHGLEHGALARPVGPARRDRPGAAVLLRPLLRRPLPAAPGRQAHGAAACQLVGTRGAVHRGGRERAAVRHPVPPREVGRRRRRPAGQLAGKPTVTFFRKPIPARRSRRAERRAVLAGVPPARRVSRRRDSAYRGTPPNPRWASRAATLRASATTMGGPPGPTAREGGHETVYAAARGGCGGGAGGQAGPG